MCRIPNRKSLKPAEVSKKNFFFFDLNSYYPFSVAASMEKSYFLDGPHKRKSVIIFIFHIKCRWSKKFGPAPSSKHEIVHISTKGVLYTPVSEHFTQLQNLFKMCYVHYCEFILYRLVYYEYNYQISCSIWNFMWNRYLVLRWLWISSVIHPENKIFPLLQQPQKDNMSWGKKKVFYNTLSVCNLLSVTIDL